METILKTGYCKIIRLFYEDEKVRIHLRDIARKVKLNENSATRFLKTLEKEKLLVFEREGNMKKYRIKKSNKIALIFTSFDIERFEKLPPIRKRAINYFFEKLGEKPLIAVLFGSTALGNFREDSDIDLLLVVNKKINIEEAEKYVDAQTGIKVTCFQIAFDSFINELRLKKDKVIQSALNTGYPIFNQMFFYEVYLNED